MTLLSADEAARRLGVKVETVYAYVSRGALRRRRRSGSRASWFDEADVELMARRGRPRRSTSPPAIDFVVESGITSIVGQTIRYRGHDIAALATTATFEQVAGLLWSGLLAPHSSWAPSTFGARGLRGVDALRLAVVLRAASDLDAGDLDGDAVVVHAEALLGAMVDALPARADPTVPRLSLPGGTALSGTIAGRVSTRLARGRPTRGVVTAVNAALVLLADHELAASTMAARVAASTRADPYGVVLAGLGALAGPLHGRASRNAAELLKAAVSTGAPAALACRSSYPGFGHALYPDGDPRAVVLLDLLRRLGPREHVVRVADEVITTVRRRRGLEPNIDFALAVLTLQAGMQEDAGETLFALSRSAGWIAHALEEYRQPPLRFRARALFARSRQPDHVKAGPGAIGVGLRS